MSSVLRANTRKENERLNILTFPYKNDVINFLCSTGHNIFLCQNDQVRWDFQSPTPDNLNLLDFTKGDYQIPLYLNFDLIFCPTRNSGFVNWVLSISSLYHIPLLWMEDTPLNPNPNLETLEKIKRLVGDTNIFQTEFIRQSWLFFNDLNSSVMSYDKRHLSRWDALLKHTAKKVYTGQRHYD